MCLSQVLTSQRLSKGLVRSRVSRFPSSGSGLGPGGSFPSFLDLYSEESRYKTNNNSKAPSNVTVMGRYSRDSTTAIFQCGTDALLHSSPCNMHIWEEPQVNPGRIHHSKQSNHENVVASSWYMALFRESMNENVRRLLMP